MGELGGDLDLAEESLGAERGGQIGTENLERDSAVVLEVVGEIHHGHPAPTQFPLDDVAVGEGGRKPLQQVGHRPVPLLGPAGHEPEPKGWPHGHVVERRQLGHQDGDWPVRPATGLEVRVAAPITDVR